ncbi:hypothetical protein Pyn_03284 [Prunus yedoensis var. nudiflora]|uniref:Uncharacterized protein n=1 Tax=Prunus yedoensis var. nudiflora TaxID=2094558 RepID=A0A314Z4L8_PRUYE|nr:hypothetical protein Pyn_03284 [Prunus yedoensis var. nudiflora]
MPKRASPRAQPWTWTLAILTHYGSGTVNLLSDRTVYKSRARIAEMHDLGGGRQQRKDVPGGSHEMRYLGQLAVAPAALYRELSTFPLIGF